MTKLKSVTSAIKICTLDTSTICRVDHRSFETLEELEKKAVVMSLAVDESDTAQLCIYVQFFDSKCFREKFLHIKSPTSLISTGTFRNVG